MLAKRSAPSRRPSLSLALWVLLRARFNAGRPPAELIMLLSLRQSSLSLSAHPILPASAWTITPSCHCHCQLHVNHFKIQTNTARGVRTIIDGLSRLIIERRYVDDIRRERQAHVPMARTTSVTSASLHSWPSPSHSHSFIFLGGITLFINKVIRGTKALRRT